MSTTGTIPRLLLPERETLPPGVYDDIENERYHKLDAISASGLNKLRRSPAHYLASILYPKESTPAQVFGSAVHALVLEPDKFAAEYVQEPTDANGKRYDMRTKAGQEAKAQMLAEHPGASILTLDDWDKAHRMRESVMAHPIACDYFTGGKAEASVLWDDPEHGVRCKVRPDYWQGAHVRDLKTTTDCRYDGFVSSVWEYGYFVQAAMYLDGTKADDFTFVAVEKEEPYAVMVYELEEHFLDLGMTTYRDLLAQYAQCRAANDWPGYPTYKAFLSQPPWTFTRIG